MTGRVTIHDLAEAAGVSITTVSNALTGRGRVAPQTRTRVTELAHELGYTANPTARSLRSRRTGAIGLYLPHHTFGLEYYMHLALGAAAAALDQGLALTLIPASERTVSAPLHVDGLVVADPAVGDPILDHLRETGIPMVTCERDLHPRAHAAGRVESDHRAAVTGLLDHLGERGASRVALLCPGSETSFGADIREAYERWSTAAGAEPVVYDIPFSAQPEDVKDAVRRALAPGAAHDAVVSVPDGGASTTLQEILRRGRRVPDDLLVASYVDSPSLRGLSTPMTAVDVAPAEMGRRAADLMAGILTGSVAEGAVDVVATQLVVRASTSPSHDGPTAGFEVDPSA